MSAGESARAKARALRDQADRLRGEATRWDAGADGEERVAAALAGLDLNTTRVLHDRLLDAGTSEANLDHLVVSPAGVHLVDAKNWIGSTSVHEDSLWQHWNTAAGRRSENKNAELDKVRHMAAKAHSTCGLPVVPVLCVTGHWSSQQEKPQQVRGVHVVPLDSLVSWLQAQPAVLKPEDVGTKAVELSCGFPPAVNPGLTMVDAAVDAPPDIVTARHSRRPAPKPSRSRPSRTTRRPVRQPRSRAARPLIAVTILLLALIAIPRLAPMAGSALSRLVTHGVAQPTKPGPTLALSPQQTQALDDWRIRADLYRGHVQPSMLSYVSDVNLGTESDDCRRQQRALAPYRTGLLRAPDAALAVAAKDYDAAAQAQLAACVKNDPVALSHAQAAMSLAAARANARFNVLKGQDPTSYAAIRIL